MKRVLITCVGSGVGQSVVDSLKGAKDRYFLVGSDQNRYNYATPDCDAFVSLPSIHDSAYLDTLLAFCEADGIDIAIPGHDFELGLFARNRARFESAGVVPLVSDASLVELLRDKLAWAREFRKATDRVVASYSPADLRAGAELVYPAIAKPSGGSASAGLRILHARGDLEGVPDDYVVQPFLFPTEDDPEYAPIRAAVAAGRVVQLSEISVQLSYSRDSKLLARFASRNKLKGGVPIEIQPMDSPDVWRAIDELVSVLEAYSPRGPVNVQGRMTPDGLVFFEMNPRFTGITGNRSQFGYNEVSLLVDNFLDGVERPLFANPRKVGARQVACRAWPRQRFHFEPGAREPRMVVVSGGTGWLSRHVATARAEGGDSVVVVSREESLAAAEALYGQSARVRVVGADSPSLADLMAAADAYVNLASARPPHGADAIGHAHAYQQRLLDLAEAANVPVIVNASSQSVYEMQGVEPKREGAALDLATPYAFSKFAIEQTLASLSRRQPGVSIVSLRFGRLFGAADGFRPQEFPHRVVAAALSNDTIRIPRPHDVMDLLDVRDAVAAVGFALDAPTPWRAEVFNVGSGRPITVAEFVALVDRIARGAGAPGLVAVTESDRPTVRSGLDIGRFTRAGWRPTVSLERSIEELLERMRDA